MNLLNYIRKQHELIHLIKVIIPKEIQTRPMTQEIKKHFDYPVTMIEIGTYLADNAKNILKNVNIKKLYLIDPYFDDYTDKKGNERYKIAQKNISAYKDKIQFIRDTSENAIKNFTEESIDAVYIDGRHAYDYVIKDIEMYYPIVKKGGIIGGHDYNADYGGVIRAVCKFVTENKLWHKLECKQNGWWMIK